MQEWLNWPLSKSGKAATPSRVRIPLSPPKYRIQIFRFVFYILIVGLEPEKSRVRIAQNGNPQGNIPMQTVFAVANFRGRGT